MTRKLILLNGMASGPRVFRKLAPLLPDCEVVEWISPEYSGCSIADYARQLAKRIGADKPCDVLGVSFGGIVAQELAPLVGAEHCFVVSSIGSSAELSLSARVISGLPNALQRCAMKSAGGIACAWPCRPTPGTIRIRKFAGEDGPWFRWATSAALSWMPSKAFGHSRVIRIHGDKDETFPRWPECADHLIEGGHLLAFTNAKALAEIVTQYRNSPYSPA